MKTLFTISIIEDDNKFALLMKKLIEQEEDMACVAIYNNLKSSLTDLAQNPPDVVLLDIQLPDGLGSEYVDVLKKVSPDSKFIMCTSFDDDAYIFHSQRHGAMGYLVKSDPADRIIASIRDVINGGAPMSSGIARKVVEHFRQQTRSLEALTPKENALLALLAEGLFYKEIAARLEVTIDTVKKHASSIYRKLQVSNRTEAINKFKEG